MNLNLKWKWNNLLKIDLKQRNLIILLSIGIFSFILILFLYLPLAGKIRNKSLEWNSLKNELNVMHTNLGIFQKGTVNKRLILQQEISSTIDEITKEGKSLQLNFKSINQKEIKDSPDKYAILPVEMEIEGRYEQLGRFFGILENLKDSVITVEKFNIRRDERILPKISASLVINLYCSVN